MEKWFLDFENWLGQKYGYSMVVHLEDTILCLASVFLGMLIMSVLSGKVVFKIQKVKDLGGRRIKLVRFKNEGVSHVIADPNSVGESVETLLLIIFRPAFQKKKYDYRDEKRTKWFLFFLVLLGITLFFFAILCISTIVHDGQ